VSDSTGYRCIVMDPPWAEYGGGGRGAQNHYALLKTSDIARVILRSPAWHPAPSSHLWMWVTDNYLLDGLSLIDTLGFRYVRTFCWVKMATVPVYGPKESGNTAIDTAEAGLQIGLGQYARGSHELCLFATRGETSLPDRAPPSVLFAPRREHSRKPDECFARWFESVSPGPRLKMFARTARPGWNYWGNESAKFVAEVVAAP
jgi:N6-adenosine-specific RNA methylase IME4